MQKQLDGMDSDVYQEYVKIPEEDRNEEQQAYVNKWENLKRTVCRYTGAEDTA